MTANRAIRWTSIEKSLEHLRVAPNLADYDTFQAQFSWEQARAELAGLPGGRGLNIAHEAVDRHAAGAGRDRLALRWLGRDGRVTDFSYDELRTLSNRFANLLRSLGVSKGDRVFTLAGRIPALYVTALGTLKNGSVFCPLFSAFSPEPVATRLRLGDGKVLVTTAALYRRKVAPIRATLPALEQVLIVGSSEGLDHVHDFDRLLAESGENFEIPVTDPEDWALLHFTSGTTGTPKGVIHVHGAVVAPREIDFQSGLPKTRSGKIMRRLLKARELGLPEGDLSSLEAEQPDPNSSHGGKR